MLIRASERGPESQAAHPWNPLADVRGWTLSRSTGLERIAVNLVWIPAGKESFAYHRHFREEEWVYVLAGHGVALVEGVEHSIGPGDFLGFRPGVAHLLRNAGPAELHLLAGGEVFDDVEVADFPLLQRRMVRAGSNFAGYEWSSEVPFVPGSAPAVAVDKPSLIRATERAKPFVFKHPNNPNSHVELTSLSRACGLKRVAVGLAALPQGRESFAWHTHHHDEEWLFVLRGHGVAELGDTAVPIGPGDFLGFVPKGPGHNTRAVSEDFLCLQGGDAWSRNSVEIVDMPRLGLRRTMLGTRDAVTFKLDDALERQAK